MSKEITITLPSIDETIITAIENETVATLTTETQAIQALREKYATLARQNGVIKTGWCSRGDDSNWREETETFLERDGRKIKALLCVDGWDSNNSDQNSGGYCGSRLYLTQFAEWIELTRTGSWSRWQGTPQHWTCAADEDGDGEGAVLTLTDAQVAEQYEMTSVVYGLSEALKKLAEKLPQRLAKVQQRAALASQLLAALK